MFKLYRFNDVLVPFRIFDSFVFVISFDNRFFDVLVPFHSFVVILFDEDILAFLEFFAFITHITIIIYTFFFDVLQEFFFSFIFFTSKFVYDFFMP